MKLNVNKFISFILLPIALSLAFDVSFFTRVCLFTVFVAGSYRCGSTSVFFLRFWQAFCFSALVCLLLSKINNQLITPITAFLSLLISVVYLLWNKEYAQAKYTVNSDKGFLRDVIAAVTVLFVAYQAPRGKSANLRYLIAEDNEGWLRTPLNSLRIGDLDLQLVFNTTSIQYFIKFTLNNFLFIFKPIFNADDSDAATSINVVSNAWIFLAVSSVLLVLLIFEDFFVTLNKKAPSIFVFSSISVISFAFFRASLLNGHFAQYLLNIVVYSFIISIVELSRLKRIRMQKFHSIVCVATGAAMVGSYNPWIGISGGAIFLVVNLIFKPTLLTRIFSDKRLLFAVPFLIAAFWFAYKFLSSRYGMLDDGGGIWVLNTEPIWIFVFLSVSIVFVIATDFFISRRYVSEFTNRKLSTTNLWIVVPLFAFLLSFVLIPREFDRYQWLSLLLVVSLYLYAIFSGELKRITKVLFTDSSYLSVLYLGAGSLVFVIYVWVASRFVGPVFEPMYAAHKSLLSFVGQFFWLPVGFLVLLEVSGTKFVKRVKDGSVVVLLTLSIGIFPIIRNSPDLAPVNAISNLGGDWWIEPTLAAHDRDNQALVVCVNGDASVDAFSVYNCNRFSSTLSLDGEVANSFRGVAWNNPDSYLGIPEILRSIDSSRRIVVLVNGQLTEETRGLLAVPDKKIEIIEVG